MSNSEQAKEVAISHLREAITSHRPKSLESCAKIGDLYDSFSGRLRELTTGDSAALSLAADFLDGWSDSCNHGWLFYEGIGESDWPVLAEELIRNIASDEDVTNPLLLKHFSRRARSGTNGLFGRFRALLRKLGV